MKTAIIIPARYASTRYPGKPLAELRTKEGTLFGTIAILLLLYLSSIFFLTSLLEANIIFICFF